MANHRRDHVGLRRQAAAYPGNPSRSTPTKPLEIVDTGHDFRQRQIVRHGRISFNPRPCEPNRGLRTSGPSPVRVATIARAAAKAIRRTMSAGVGMPALAIRKLVVDLSTQRSIARASFQTGTPKLAQRMQNAQPHGHRLKRAAGNSSHDHGVAAIAPPKPGTRVRIWRSYRIARATDEKEPRTPSAANDLVNCRACQS